MKLNMIIAAASVFLLSGCWGAENKLMPDSEKVNIPLSGIYDDPVSDGRRNLEIQQLNLSQYKVIENVDQEKSIYDFSLDRLSGLEVKMDGMSTTGYQISETIEFTSQLFVVEAQSEAFKNDVFYSILLIAADKTGKPIELIHFEPNCSAVTRKITGQNGDDQTCVFRNYEQVKSAARDLAEWLKDARVPPISDQVFRRGTKVLRKIEI